MRDIRLIVTSVGSCCSHDGARCLEALEPSRRLVTLCEVIVMVGEERSCCATTCTVGRSSPWLALHAFHAGLARSMSLSIRCCCHRRVFEVIARAATWRGSARQPAAVASHVRRATALSGSGGASLAGRAIGREGGLVKQPPRSRTQPQWPKGLASWTRSDSICRSTRA